MHEPSINGGRYLGYASPTRALPRPHLHTSRGAGGLPHTAMGWRPSRRLSGRTMWALWLVCLVGMAVAVCVEEITEYRVGPVTSVPMPGLVSFLSFALAWLWHDRRRVRRM